MNFSTDILYTLLHKVIKSLYIYFLWLTYYLFTQFYNTFIFLNHAFLLHIFTFVKYIYSAFSLFIDVRVSKTRAASWIGYRFQILFSCKELGGFLNIIVVYKSQRSYYLIFHGGRK